jgi:transcriptional regulator with XRE-family HTH domain
MKTSYRELDYESGKTMQTLRNKMGLTQAAQAKHLGISARTVREWEGGGSYPTTKHLKALVTLAIQYQVFPKGSEVREIHALWETTHQKWRLDEDWLSQLLLELPAPQVQSHLPPPHEEASVPTNRSQDVKPPPSGLEIDGADAASPQAPAQQGHTATKPSQNRARMLRRLGHAYSELMSQSLQGAAWLELGLTHKPDAVQNAANLLLRMQRGTGQDLPADTSIVEVYDAAEHELLILGEPGAGKSTLLLDLAQKLVVRAEQDETHPLPVILPLSTFAVKRLKFEDWIAEQMAEIYDVPRTVVAQWVREDAILPLLDGLDEMEEALRPACIEWINAYHHSSLLPLVASSRKAEYEVAALHTRLTLQSAVVVQPLTHTQVESYLFQMGKPLRTLRTTLRENPALQELVTTPLMLNVLILTYRETRVNHLPETQAPLQEQVWTDYVTRMVERKGDSKRYPHERTLSWLSWLAQHMQSRNLTTFYLEHLQPDWLEAKQQRTYNWWAVRLPGILIGILVSLAIAMFLASYQDPTSRFQYGVLGALLGTVYTRNGQGRRHEWRKYITISLFVGLLLASSFGLERYYWYYPEWYFSSGMVCFLSFVPVVFLLQYFLKKRSFVHGSAPLNRHAGRWKRLVHPFQTRYAKHFLLGATMMGLAYGLDNGLSFGLLQEYGLDVGLRYGLSDGLRFGLIFGLTTAAHVLEERKGSEIGDLTFSSYCM